MRPALFSALLFPVAVMAAPVNDSGYPIVPAQAYNSTATRAVSLTTTTNPSLIVAGITWDCDFASTYLPTVSGGSGLSWQSLTTQAMTGTYANYAKARWFWASSSANQNGQTVTLTRGTGSGNCATQIYVGSFTGAASVSPVIDAGGKAGSCSGGAGTTDNFTFTASAAGSWVGLALIDASQQVTFSPNAATSTDRTSTNASQGSTYGLGHLGSPTSGAVSVTPGWTASATNGCYAAAAIEIKASGGAPPAGPSHSGMSGFWGLNRRQLEVRSDGPRHGGG